MRRKPQRPPRLRPLEERRARWAQVQLAMAIIRRRRWTDRQAAEALGLGMATISRWRVGMSEPLDETLEKIAAWLAKPEQASETV